MRNIPPQAAIGNITGVWIEGNGRTAARRAPTNAICGGLGTCIDEVSTSAIQRLAKQLLQRGLLAHHNALTCVRGWQVPRWH
jgi:hypothetical protein